MDEGVGLLEERGGEEKGTGGGDDDGGVEGRECREVEVRILASFLRDEVRCELPVVGAVEGEGEIGVGRGPANEPAKTKVCQ